MISKIWSSKCWNSTQIQDWPQIIVFKMVYLLLRNVFESISIIRGRRLPPSGVTLFRGARFPLPEQFIWDKARREIHGWFSCAQGFLASVCEAEPGIISWRLIANTVRVWGRGCRGSCSPRDEARKVYRRAGGRDWVSHIGPLSKK